MNQVLPLLAGNEEDQAQDYGRSQFEKQSSSHILHTIELVEDPASENENTSIQATQQAISGYQTPGLRNIMSSKTTHASLGKPQAQNNMVDIEAPFRIELETADGHIQTITLPQLGPGADSSILAEEVIFKGLSKSQNSSENDTGLCSEQLQSRKDIYTMEKSKTTCSMGTQRKKFKSTEKQSRRMPHNKCVPNESCSLTPALEWLAGITENINETMHYSCSGKPEPLVFQATEKYFELLRSRISEACTNGKVFIK